jgi:hypothetical protein
MVALVIFPDTDTLARKYLLQGLAEHGVTGIAVATQLPSPMQNRFIRCFTIPGREISRRTQTVQVVAQFYDTKGNDVRCSQLAQLGTAVLRAAPDMVVDGQQWVSEPCEKQGPIPYEDPDLPGIPRYQGTVFWTVQSTVSQ